MLITTPFFRPREADDLEVSVRLQLGDDRDDLRGADVKSDD
jgi:hypothetical protein